MKSSKSFNILSFIIFFFLIKYIHSSITFNFPSAIKLDNGYIFVIDELGIYIYDETVTNLIRTEYLFDEEDKIRTKDDLSRVIIKKYKSQYLCMINYKIFIFDNEGQLLYKNSQFLFNRLPNHYTLIPIGTLNGDIYYIIGYYDSSVHLNFLLYKYEIQNNKTTLILTKTYEYFTYYYYDYGYYYTNNYYFKNKIFSCEYLDDLYYGSDIARLTCFFVVYKNSYEYITNGFYKVTSSSIEQVLYLTDKENIQNIEFIKSESNYNYQRALVCYILSTNKAFCKKFYLYKEIGYFYKTISFSKECRNELYGLKLTYLTDTEEVAFSCSGTDGSIQAAFFDQDLTTPNSAYIQFTSCESIYGYSIL